MPRGPAARILDPVVHPAPGVLTPGPGSFNVFIGGKPAWRGVPAAAAAAINSAKAASDATIQTAEAATLAAAGTPGAPAAKAAEEATKAAAAASMGAMISGAAGGADIHACMTPLPIPPHGPGVVIDGSPTVLINNLPACRQGDTIIEAVGPPDKIAMGLPTVIIGDVGGGSGGGGGGTGADPGASSSAAAAPAGAPAPGGGAAGAGAGSGLGKDVDELAKNSPTLQNNLKALKDQHWTIRYTQPGDKTGSYTDKQNKVIVHLGDGDYNGKQNQLRVSENRADFEPGKFITPHGAWFDRAGNIFVTEWVEIGRVTKLRKIA